MTGAVATGQYTSSKKYSNAKPCQMAAGRYVSAETTAT